MTYVPGKLIPSIFDTEYFFWRLPKRLLTRYILIWIFGCIFILGGGGGELKNGLNYWRETFPILTICVWRWALLRLVPRDSLTLDLINHKDLFWEEFV